jgi:hypothetical protein
VAIDEEGQRFLGGVARTVTLRYQFEVLERVIGGALLAATSGVCVLGCATQRELIDRSASAGMSPCSFWPPPPSTSVAQTPNTLPAGADGLSTVATRIAAQLRGAGYPKPRWYPIGLEYRHGFAATTRLEALNDDAAPRFPPERWSSLYPEPATLRWLTLARRVPLPHPGRYRVFLFAVTDLPLRASGIAPVWSEETVMDGPGVGTEVSSPAAMGGVRDLSGYRLGVYVYQYERRQDQIQGEPSTSGVAWSATEQLRAAGISQLVESPLVDRH